MEGASPPPPSSGLVAGKYELVRLIGRGGMGSVWEGRHLSLGTRVAIKFIEAEYADSREARTRFDNEARAAATLQSKHAIQIYDHGVTDDAKPYIVMELLQGEPLDKRLDRLGRLPLPEVARFVQQVCRALQRAHDKGIIHRDLKPENIFIVHSPDDDEEIAKVLDFGIAKFKGPAAEGLSSSTKTGAVLGTPYFMSPEQARGLRTIDHRTDLWSIGVIVFRCVTGVLPFDGESVGDLLVKICTAPPPVPSQVTPGLSPAFDAWFARALEREPDRRFSSASELAEALALTCGVSIRRGPTSGERSSHPTHPEASRASGPAFGATVPQSFGASSPTTEPSPGFPGHAALPTPNPAAPSVTQSPLTTSSRTQVSSPKKIAAMIGAVVVGGLVATFALLSGGARSSDSSLVAAPTSASSAPPPSSGAAGRQAADDGRDQALANVTGSSGAPGATPIVAAGLAGSGAGTVVEAVARPTADASAGGRVAPEPARPSPGRPAPGRPNAPTRPSPAPTLAPLPPAPSPQPAAPQPAPQPATKPAPTIDPGY